MKSVGFGVGKGYKVLDDGAHERVMDDDKAASGGGEFTEEGCHRMAEMGGGFT